MATKRKRKKNSAVRMGGEFDTAILNPSDNEEIQITISAPKGSTLGSDIAMLAAQKGIDNTRGNPRKRKRSYPYNQYSVEPYDSEYSPIYKWALVDTKGNIIQTFPLKKQATEAAKYKNSKITKKRKAPMPTKMFGNPIHYPKTRAQSGTHKFVGRPAAEKWWILDLMDRGGRKIKTEIGKGSKKKAETEAIGFIDHRVKARGGGNKTVKSAMLSGPYARRPKASAVRK